MNLCGGNRVIPISLIYSGIFINNLKDINIKSLIELSNLMIEINSHKGEF